MSAAICFLCSQVKKIAYKEPGTYRPLCPRCYSAQVRAERAIRKEKVK